MGLNLGAIHVRVKNSEVTQQKIADFIRHYWIRLGAKSSDKNALQFQPLTLAKTGNLGFAILTQAQDNIGNHWIAVYDSERYLSDVELASAIAEHFNTDVWSWSISEASGEAVASKFSGSSKVCELNTLTDVITKMDPLPKENTYYDQILIYPSDDVKDLLLVALESIPFREGREYSGPE